MQVQALRSLRASPHLDVLKVRSYPLRLEVEQTAVCLSIAMPAGVGKNLYVQEPEQQQYATLLLDCTLLRTMLTR